MYQNTTAQFRPELHTVVQQAQAADRKFIAEQIYPVYPVKTRTGDYMKIKRGKGQLLASAGNATSADPLLRAPGTSYGQITRTFEKSGWNCKDRGLKEPLDDVNSQDLARFFDVESSTSVWLSRNVRIGYERRVAGQIFNETTWGKIDGGINYTEANLAAIDFATDIDAAKAVLDKRQEDVNALVMSRDLWSIIRRSAKLRSYFFGDNGGNAQITLKMIQEEFGVMPLIGRASYDTTKPGKDSSDDNLVWCWPDTHFWVGNVQGGAPEMGGAGRTFILEDLTSGELLVPETYRDEDKRSDILRVRQDTDEASVNELSGLLCKVSGLA